MISITQYLKFKQALVGYSFKHGVTAAATRYKRTRQWIYYWRKRYDGTIQSLAEYSGRPHSHPNSHTDAELKLIDDMRKRNTGDGLVVFWVKLRRRGYTRSVPSLFRVMRREGYFEKLGKKKPKYTAKPYEQMKVPGERVRIDVKYVPENAQKLWEKEQNYINSLQSMSAPGKGT